MTGAELFGEEWSLAPGECDRCHAYVRQLVRTDGGPWLCDECAEKEEDDV